jgi:hypothetical protein
MVAVRGVAVLAVLEIQVVQVLDRRVPAALAMDVHVAGVGQVQTVECRCHIIHVIDVQVVDVAIMEVVQVVAMGHRCVTAPPVMPVGVGLVRLMLQRRARRHGPDGRTDRAGRAPPARPG